MCKDYFGKIGEISTNYMGEGLRIMWDPVKKR